MLARYGSSTRPLPSSSINNIVSIAVPPRPPSASANGNASQPRSAIVLQCASLHPGSPSASLRRASSPYFSRTKRATLSLSSACSLVNSKFMASVLPLACADAEHILREHVLLYFGRAARDRLSAPRQVAPNAARREAWTFGR